MSDTQETNLNNNEENVQTTEPRKAIDPSLEGIQLFYEQNKKAVNYIGGGLLVAIVAFFFFKFYYLPEQENEAANELFWAENYFEVDSFNLALKGGIMVNSADGAKQMMGFEQVAENYGITKSGNLANYYAGVCYMRTGNFEQAIEFLRKYSGKDEIISSIALGAIGDCSMELNRVDDAVKYYTKAAQNSRNAFTAPIYLKKAGFAHEQKGNYANALEVYERIQKEFPRSEEGREIERDIAKVKALGNL
ncbi:MAG: tetratricopeptide repeat protein [Bacteroidetes bacterium]|nr:tetratricopeptide repeat protein [Bacteroidota bacterium]